MELSRKHVLPPNRRCERFAILCPRCNQRSTPWFRKKAVDEINVASIRDALEQWTSRLRNFDLVPADLRDLQSPALLEAHHLAFENAHPCRATVELLAPFKK